MTDVTLEEQDDDRPDRVVVYRDTANEYRWRRSAPNGRILADSSEGYRHRDECERMARRVNGPAGERLLYEVTGA